MKRIYDHLGDFLEMNKVLVLYGPRQVGKTTLLNRFLETTSLRYRLESGENLRMHAMFERRNFDELKEYMHGYDLLAIDEAQKIPLLGEVLKILVDTIPHIQIIVTGSASFQLAGQVGEPLTGRKNTITLFPFSQMEIVEEMGRYDAKQMLENTLIFGSYPEVFLQDSFQKKQNRILEITDSYLFKDILELERLKNSKLLRDLLRLLAFQIGSEVSFNELSRALGIDIKTVQKYIDILEKTFILFSLSGLSRNLRNEVHQKKKYYFYDLGIRNSIIQNFNSLALRNDVGMLWENFIVLERMKTRAYTSLASNVYFWRTWEGQEIDLIEERSGSFFAYECKWSVKKQLSCPKKFEEAYAPSAFVVVSPENYLDILTEYTKNNK